MNTWAIPGAKCVAICSNWFNLSSGEVQSLVKEGNVYTVQAVREGSYTPGLFITVQEIPMLGPGGSQVGFDVEGFRPLVSDSALDELKAALPARGKKLELQPV